MTERDQDQQLEQERQQSVVRVWERESSWPAGISTEKLSTIPDK